MSFRRDDGGEVQGSIAAAGMSLLVAEDRTATRKEFDEFARLTDRQILF